MLLRCFSALAVLAAIPESAVAATYAIDGDVIGDMTYYQPNAEDNLYEIARRFDIGIVEILAANPGIDPWLPPAEKLSITTAHILPPAQHEGIVINLAELRLFYYPDQQTVMTFPIGIGRDGWQTPTGTTRILAKHINPVWTPPASIREENPDLPDIIPAGPDNPLGAYALDTGWIGYIIHGTNRPYGIGKRSSHGCIRLYPEDIEALFEVVSEGTPVTVIDTPFKLGWRGDALYLEVTPTQEQSDIIAEYKNPEPVHIPDISKAIEKIAADGTVIDWYALEQAVIHHSGIPVAIATRPAAFMP